MGSGWLGRGVLIWCVLLQSLSARAQNDPAVFEEARRSFERGVELLDRGDARGAIEKFEHSLALRESLAALYNLGLAYRKADRFKDALRTFERFLDWAATEQHIHGVDHAKLLADELRGTIGRVSLVVSGGADSVRVDGEALGDRDGTYGLVLDPGTHLVEASRAGSDPTQVNVKLDPGASLDVRLDLPREESASAPVVEAPPPIAVVQAPPPAPPPPEPLIEQWWFWTVIGVVAAGAAAGIIVAVRRPDAEYDRGTNDVLLQVLQSR